MGCYTVVAPCVVGDLHYAQVPAEPVEVDDTLAAALVAAGVLTPVPTPQPEPEQRGKRRAPDKD